MEPPFDSVHETWRSQLGSGPVEVADSRAVALARAAAVDAAGFAALGDALSRQLRYLEATEAYGRSLELEPGNMHVYRRRCGRLLSTLRLNEARHGLLCCLVAGWDELDVRYRLGLCGYMSGVYGRAMEQFELCMPLGSDEMGIAAIYWHTLCALRSGAEPGLLAAYHSGMDVGHHTAYEKAVRVISGEEGLPDALAELGAEPDDLEYGITAYGLSVLLQSRGEAEESRRLAGSVLRRDSFWPGYAFLAAYSDKYGSR